MNFFSSGSSSRYSFRCRSTFRLSRESEALSFIWKNLKCHKSARTPPPVRTPALATFSGFEGDNEEKVFLFLLVYVFLAMVKIVLKATSRRQVLPAVPNLLHSVQVEGTFSDGTKLITVHDAIACENEDL
ncbi:Os12g0234800 [Linum perenne]